MGNSEVGHTNIGAGRIVYQQLTRITRDIRRRLLKNEALLTIVRGVKENDGALHVMGLVSPGGVHSHEDHLFATLELAHREGIKTVWDPRVPRTGATCRPRARRNTSKP